MSQEVIEITEREIEVIEVVEKGPAGPVGPQANINYTVVSSPQTLSNSQNIAADTSGGSFTLTLPASPNAGDSIDIFDYSETFDTNPLTIARNGENIESIAEDLICNVEGAYFTMIYTGATRGWQILPRYGTSGGGGESVLTTQGDMVYRGAAINERLPIGSAGQILKVNSGGNAPEWGAAPATGVTSVGVSGSDGIEVDSGSPVTGSGTIALGVNAATLRSHINVADGANNYTHPNHSGEVTSSGDGATTIANDVVTNAKLANVDTATIKGRATAGTGDPEDLSASQVRTILNVADGAEVNVNADWDASSGDAQILNKPASFTPTAHASSHHTGGSDAIAPSDIGAQSILEVIAVTASADTTLTASRAARYDILNFTGTALNITLPTTSVLAGDVAIIQSPVMTGSGSLVIRRLNADTSYTTLATITKSISSGLGETFRFYTAGASSQDWRLDVVPNHGSRHAFGGPDALSLAASQITSGTLAHERGGLEADVSAYDGLVKIASGSTSAVTVTAAGEALLDDADAAAQRTTLGLGTAATSASTDFAAASHTHGNLTNDGKIGSTAGLPLKTGTAGVVEAGAFGGGAGEFAEGNHTHELANLDATGATDGYVLTADGAGGAAWEAVPAGDTVSINASAADVLSVASGEISAVDATADKIVFWDDSASELTYLAPVGPTFDGTNLRWPVELVVACSDESTDLTTGTAKVTFRAPYAFLLTGVRASVNTAPTGSTLIVDINNGANSALSTKLSIDASEKTSTTAATAAVIDTTYDDFSDDAEITIDIDQIGSTIAGKGLKVVLKGTRA